MSRLPASSIESSSSYRVSYSLEILCIYIFLVCLQGELTPYLLKMFFRLNYLCTGGQGRNSNLHLLLEICRIPLAAKIAPRQDSNLLLVKELPLRVLPTCYYGTMFRRAPPMDIMPSSGGAPFSLNVVSD